MAVQVNIRKYTLGHHAGSDIVNILADNINSSPRAAIREAVTNAFDAESQKVIVQINSKEIKIEDYGTGILDIKDFTDYGSASKKRIALKSG
jgi:DNA mismatch repair ATPase MutL